MGLFEDDCEATCRVTSRELDHCLTSEDWSALGADDAADWRTQCQDDWTALVRALSDLERQQALESCEAMLTLSREASCEELSALYRP